MLQLLVKTFWREQDHDYFNFDLVDEAFIQNLLGNVNPLADFYA